MQRAEILIIDNLMESVALLLRYFQNEPIDAMVALNGVDGLRKAREGQPDVILLDVAMPGMDGYAARSRRTRAPQPFQSFFCRPTPGCSTSSMALRRAAWTTSASPLVRKRS